MNTQTITKNITIFANGVFDILTPGHYKFLQFCVERKEKEGATKLIIGIDSDDKVKKDKGGNRPYFTEKERKKTLAQLFPEIDAITIFDSAKELESLICSMSPILVESERWRGYVVGQEYAKKTTYFVEQASYSTTEIENRIADQGFIRFNYQQPTSSCSFNINYDYSTSYSGSLGV